MLKKENEENKEAPKELTVSMEELAEVIGKTIDAKLSEKGFDRKEVEQPKEDEETPAEENKEFKGTEKAQKFLQAVAGGNHAEIKALSEGTDADGGYLVPTEFRAIVIEKLLKEAVIRPNAQVIPMGKDQLEIPIEGAAVVTYWVAENSDLTESNPDWGQLVLNTNKLTGYAKTSRELLADASIDIVNYIAGAFAKSFAAAEDTAFMGGSGSGQPKGLRQYSITQTQAQVGADLTAEDLIELFYTLPVSYRKRASFLIHNDIMKLVRKLKDSSGRYLWADGLEAAMPTILGRPVLEQNDIPVNLGTGTDESEIWFGDLSYYIIGDRQTMALETSTQSGDAFLKHQMHIKVIQRLDGQLALVDAFATLTAVK